MAELTMDALKKALAETLDEKFELAEEEGDLAMLNDDEGIFLTVRQGEEGLEAEFPIVLAMHLEEYEQVEDRDALETELKGVVREVFEADWEPRGYRLEDEGIWEQAWSDEVDPDEEDPDLQTYEVSVLRSVKAVEDVTKVIDDLREIDTWVLVEE